MQLTGFQIFNYRNIIDSGWIETTDIAALVGQNECGKSNLLRALYALNPLDGDTKYNIESDWPVDKWADRDPNQVVCRAKFTFTEGDIKELLRYCRRGQISDGLVHDSDEVDMVDNGGDMSLSSFDVIVEKNYNNELSIDFPADIPNLDDKNKVWEWVPANMPECFYMEDSSVFPGRANLKVLSERLNRVGNPNLSIEEEPILIVLDLAGLEINALVDKETSDEGRTLRGFDTGAASRYLTQLFNPKWGQGAVRFMIRVDGPTLDIMVEDEVLNAFIPLRSRSRGFQWFVSFIWRFTHATKSELTDYILLLDEPGIHLHQAGHSDLLNFFEELSDTNTIIYTTHLATMLDPAHPERVKIMEVNEHHTTVLNSVVSSQIEPMMVIESRLGLANGMSKLLESSKNLIVESINEVLVLEKLSGILRGTRGKGLAEGIRLIPSHGVENIPIYVDFMTGNKFNACVILASDEAGENMAREIKRKYSPDSDYGNSENGSLFKIVMLGTAVERRQISFGIEDIFPADFYLECVNEAYRTNFKESDLPEDDTVRILKRVESVLNQHGIADKVDKNLVLKPIQARLDSVRRKIDLPEGVYEKGLKLIDKINFAFGS